MIKGNKTIRHLFRNGKRISRITRGNDVIFRDNLFNGYDSEWSFNAGITIATGAWGNTGGERLMFFFNCKPNTTYRYTATSGGDRFCIFALDTPHDNPPIYSGGRYPYGAASSDIHIIENRNTYQINSTKDYTFTTSSTDRMVYIYCGLNIRPTGIYVREV